jgi:hypothetical protein
MKKTLITKLIPVILATMHFSAVSDEEKENIIGINPSSLSLYESPTAREKTGKLPKSDFASMEILEVSGDGKRYQVDINSKKWWVKKRQVKTDKKYNVDVCSKPSDTTYAAVRGAGECK